LSNAKWQDFTGFQGFTANLPKLTQSTVPSYAEIVSMTPQEVLDKAAAE
jgi:hypothetical protein